MIKLEKQSTFSQYECQIKLKYTTNNGENNVKIYPVWIIIIHIWSITLIKQLIMQYA